MPNDLVGSLCADLEAEHADLERILVGLPPADWDKPTPAEGWSVRDQVAHLWVGDDRARFAVSEPEAFKAERTDEAKRWATRDRIMEQARTMAPDALLGAFREERARMLEAFRAADPGVRVPWYGPDMSVASFITARIMETWAHGQDIIDAVGGDREPTERLRHIAYIGFRARPFSYSIHNRELPAEEVAVELTAPNGEVWVWGDSSGPNRIRGSALDFCRVITQRRHVTDTGLRVEGPLAEEWIAIGQAFAGPPGTGRRPGQFPKGK